MSEAGHNAAPELGCHYGHYPGFCSQRGDQLRHRDPSDLRRAGRDLHHFHHLFQYEGELPESIQTELFVFTSSINDILEITKIGFKNRNPKISVTIQLYREVISEMSFLMNLRHIRQMHQTGTDQHLNSRLLDICYTEERLINCCGWVAGALLRYARATGGDTELPQADDPEKAQKIKALFNDKYKLLKQDSLDS